MSSRMRRAKSSSADTPAPSASLDDFWMTPAMGLRMSFSFAQHVFDITAKAEAKRRADQEKPEENASQNNDEKTAPAALPEKPLPPIPPPDRLLRY